MNYRIADCAVCTEGYAPGPSSRCHKCSGQNKGLLVAIPATVLFITLLAIALAASYLLELVGDETNIEQNQPRQWWRENLPRLHNLFVKAIPLSSIRIVVTVLQIVIQVRSVRDGFNPSFSYEIYHTISKSCCVKGGNS